MLEERLLAVCYVVGYFVLQTVDDVRCCSSIGFNFHGKFDCKTPSEPKIIPFFAKLRFPIFNLGARITHLFERVRELINVVNLSMLRLLSGTWASDNGVNRILPHQSRQISLEACRGFFALLHVASVIYVRTCQWH